MDLEKARPAIAEALERMEAAYFRPVFDEWAIIAIGARHGGIVTYRGFRAAEFVERFQEDIAMLRQALDARRPVVGEIVSVPHARDAKHDAAVRVGERSYLVLNNTAKRMAEMSTDPRWPAVEAVLAELAARFRADPLEEI